MALTLSQTRRFTADEYIRMGEKGILPPDERTELLDGRIVLKMSQGARHIGGIALGVDIFVRTLGSTHWVVPQCTVRLSKWTVPEPDFVVVSRETWRPGLSLTSGDLFVEVSDTSLTVDREVKATLYALAGVPEYWIVNLVERHIEIYRDPANTPAEACYESISIHHVGDVVAPRCRPDVSLAVLDFLPDVPASEQP